MVLASNADDQASGWTDCTNGNESTFNIPANKVSEQLNNYEFRCLVTVLVNGSAPVMQASEPVSIQAGYAVSDPSVKLNITSNQPIIQNHQFTLTANVENPSNLNYQWYYKQPSTGASTYASADITNVNPLAGWTSIPKANQSSLTVTNNYVTNGLANSEFMVVAYENDKLIYNTAIYKVNSVASEPTSSMSVTVNGEAKANTVTGCTLTAECAGTNLGYQSYYKKTSAPASESYFKTSYAKNTNEVNSEWTKIVDGGQTKQLSIPKQYIKPEITDYEFICVVYEQNDHNKYNVSSPVEINSFIQTDINIDETVMQNLVNNVFMTWDKDFLVKNCIAPEVSNPCDPATANELLKNQIANQLGILASNIESIQIDQGTKILAGQKFAADITITLTGSNSFMRNRFQKVGSNDQTKVIAVDQTLTIINASTNIGVTKINPDFAKNYSAYKEALNKITWNILQQGYANVWLKYDQAKALFDPVAKLFNIPVSFIDELAVSTEGVTYPSNKVGGVVTLKVRFLSGINVQGLNYTVPNSTNLKLTDNKQQTSVPEFYVKCSGQLWGEVTVSGIHSSSSI